MEPILAVESVGRTFGNRRVLNAAGMWARPGQITVLLGRNGAGKTTMFRITVGLLRASHGIVIYKGLRYHRPRLYQLARAGLYYLPERGVLTRWFTLQHHLDGVAKISSKSAVSSAIDVFRTAPLLGKRATAMSAGEHRRADLCLAFARSPDCLLADEPFRDLTPNDAKTVGDGLRSLASQGCAIVATGHEVRTLLAVADDVIWVTSGTTHALGTPADARDHFQFRREYLGARLIAD